MKLSELLDLDQLNAEVEAGYVKVGHHDDDDDLMIFNYTHKCQNEGRWNDVTRNCRGLIVRMDDLDTGDPTVVAQPFPKFFNLGEHPESTFNLSERVLATEKMDGSLGILYPHPKDGWAIATRGSFHSEQAVKGTEMLHAALDMGFQVMSDHLTYMFEIIYPENRIVLNYGQREELVLLGIRKIGDPIIWCPHQEESEFFRVPERKEGTLEDVLVDLERENREGWVVTFPFRWAPLHERMVKVKQEDYVRLHRIVTGLNELTVWEVARKGHREWLDFRHELPEEFWEWFDEQTTKLDRAYEDIVERVWQEFSDVADEAKQLGVKDHSREDRKRFAQAAMKRDPEIVPLIFLTLDDKFEQRREAIWKMIRPTPTNNRIETKEAA